MNDTLSIHLVQINSKWKDPAQNIRSLESIIKNIDKLGDLIILPEMWTTGFIMDPNGFAHNAKDIFLSKINRIAEQYKIDILGTYSYEENNTFYNRALLIKYDDLIESYDKRYLFTPSGEGATYKSGKKAKLINYKGWNIKLQICYDLRFPESIRDENSLDLIIYMANWPTPRIQHWQTLLKARAIENQCYTIGCNRLGTDGNGWEFPGHSLVVDHTGESLLEMSEELVSEAIYLDKSSMDSYRLKLPFLSDKK